MRIGFEGCVRRHIKVKFESSSNIFLCVRSHDFMEIRIRLEGKFE